MVCTTIHALLCFWGFTGVRGNFLGKFDNASSPHGHSIRVGEVALNLNAALESVMGEHSAEEGHRVGLIEASIWRTFQALPKNQAGRLEPRAVRYIAHNYFAKEHGWLLSGLDPESLQSDASEVHATSIMQERAPALVETMLEARQRGRGLSFEDIVVMISALEKLIFQESVSLVQHAYSLNGLSILESISMKDLHEVLLSYLLLYRLGSRANLDDREKHTDDKRRLIEFGGDWLQTIDYEHDMALNYAYGIRNSRNPFKPALYAFEEAMEIVKLLAHNYGKWQNGDCIAMKKHLMGLGSQGTGRVTLDRFYKPTARSAFQFHESLDYLRSIGALDESVEGAPQVRIANYVAGPTNCIAQSAYYSVCCLNECETLLNELEGRVQSPVASPAQLVRLVSSMDSATVDAPRQLPAALVAKLNDIGERHGGVVPLHGRLMAQWLHFVFPNECPYPEQVSAAALTPSQWLDGKAFADREEIETHLEGSSLHSDAQELPHMAQWSDDEILPLSVEPARDSPVFGSAAWILLCSARLLPPLVILRFAKNTWQRVMSVHSSKDEAKDRLGYLI